MECLSEGSRSTHFPKYAKGFMKHLPWRPIPLSLAVSKGAVGKEAGREPRGLNGGRLDTHLRTCCRNGKKESVRPSGSVGCVHRYWAEIDFGNHKQMKTETVCMD